MKLAIPPFLMVVFSYIQNLRTNHDCQNKSMQMYDTWLPTASWDSAEKQSGLTSTMQERVRNSLVCSRQRPRHFPRPSGKVRHRPRHFNAPTPCRHFMGPLAGSSPHSVPVIFINISPSKWMEHSYFSFLAFLRLLAMAFFAFCKCFSHCALP